jgi:hypothetical protein
MSSGGKSPGATWAGSFLQACQSLLEETLSPLADHLTARVKPRGDLIVVDSGCRHEDHLGSLDFKIRQRIFRGSLPQRTLFLDGQINMKWALSWHLQNFPRVCLHHAIRSNFYQKIR